MSAITLIAKDPKQLEAAQGETLKVLYTKVTALTAEAKELSSNIELAEEAGLKVDAFQRSLGNVHRRLRYYQKLVAAVEDGYFIVPNMPYESWAIRTTRKRPSKQEGTYKWGSRLQKAMRLPVGEGRYVATIPLQGSRAGKRTLTVGEDKGKVVPCTYYFNTEFTEPEFPATLVHPEIMRATTRAMQRKVFDDIGLFTNTRGDPMVLGTVELSDSHWVTFVIAWWLDPRDL